MLIYGNHYLIILLAHSSKLFRPHQHQKILKLSPRSLPLVKVIIIKQQTSKINIASLKIGNRPLINYGKYFSVECGLKASGNGQFLVVNGAPFSAGLWPWMSAIFHTSQTGLDFKCGGTLISKFHVITGNSIFFIKNVN